MQTKDSPNPATKCACSGSKIKSPTPPTMQPPTANGNSSWNKRYLALVAVFAALWLLAYNFIHPFAQAVTGLIFGGNVDTPLADTLSFFIYDTVKILLLLVALIYCIGWLRASLNLEWVRNFLAGKGRAPGYFLGAFFGAVTPFCSCSSIPLFLGFTMARIPIGISLAFLITSPLINEIAVVMLWGLLGWKFTLIYVAVGLLAGVIGGIFMDSIKAERWLQPFVLDAMNSAPQLAEQSETENSDINFTASKLSLQQRHNFAYGETVAIFKRVWKWVFMGVAVGAILHGFVPHNWFAANLGAGEWWSVPIAVMLGIPLYSNVTGVVPIMESLLLKGMPLGTTMAFCMSAVAASLPEVMLLRQIMTLKLQATFIVYLWVIFTLTGWLFNSFGVYLF